MEWRCPQGKSDPPARRGLTAAFADAFGLAAADARLLAVLYEQGGEVKPFLEIGRTCSGHAPLSRARIVAALDRLPDAVGWRTMGKGVALTAGGLRACREALQAVADALFQLAA